jgi:hypothetical protein
MLRTCLRARGADMADGSRLSYCEITGIVRRDGQPMVLGHIQWRDFMTPRGSAAREQARGVRPVGRCSLPAQRDVPHSDGVIP